MTAPPERNPERNEPPEAPPTDSRVEGWIRTMLSDSLLRPLYAVLLGHGIAFFAPILLFAFRDRNLFGLAGIAILIVGSGSILQRDWQRYRRPGPLGGTLLAVWSVSIAAAAAANHYNIL